MQATVVAGKRNSRCKVAGRPVALNPCCQVAGDLGDSATTHGFANVSRLMILPGYQRRAI